MSGNFRHIVRMGTHAEKEYLAKAPSLFDGLLFNANLVEASKGATAVFATTQRSPFSIDPVTYSFALDPRYLLAASKKKGLAVKSTFAALADAFALPKGFLGTRPLSPADLRDPILGSVVGRVIAYQRDVLADTLSEDEAFLLGDLDARVAAALPEWTFAPYFINDYRQDWLSVNVRALEFAEEEPGPDVAGILAYDTRRADHEYLLSTALAYGGDHPRTMFVWASNLDEHRSDMTQLKDYAGIVRQLASQGHRPIAAYGGFFGMLLSFRGMTGIAHGVGYGDRRDLEPVVGGGLPPATFYVRAVRDAVSVGDLTFLAADLSEGDFRHWICDCTICDGLLSRGGVAGLIAALTETDDHVSEKGNLVSVATPQVYQLTRFHYLLNRSEEVRWIRSSDLEEIAAELRAGQGWASERLGNAAVGHIERWLDIVNEVPKLD
ncbi:MAG: hypothetical protein ABSD62_03285 [Candidatus Limnocylindrales bacterium]|jgi:hypothetical protein